MIEFSINRLNSIYTNSSYILPLSHKPMLVGDLVQCKKEDHEVRGRQLESNRYQKIWPCPWLRARSPICNLLLCWAIHIIVSQWFLNILPNHVSLCTIIRSRSTSRYAWSSSRAGILNKSSIRLVSKARFVSQLKNH